MFHPQNVGPQTCRWRHQSCLCLQDSSNRMLASVGIAAVGCTAGTAFTQADADRFTALSRLTTAVSESLEPTLLPPSRPAPLGPLSHNTLSFQQQPLADPPLAERQHSAGLAVPARSAAPRGRPAKEPKLSGDTPPPPPLPPPQCPAVLLTNKYPTYKSVHVVGFCNGIWQCQLSCIRLLYVQPSYPIVSVCGCMLLAPFRGACSNTPATTVARTDQPVTG